MAARMAEGTFWDHLEEARWGIIRSLAYITLGTAAAWLGRERLFDVIRYPAEEGARRAGIEGFAFRIFDPAGGIVLMMQAALVAGVVISSPLWLAEVVAFILPALQPRERRTAFLLVPGAVGLFIAGVAFSYAISPAAFAFLFRFNLSLGVDPEVTLVAYLYFFLRLVIVFGLVFELPLVIMFLVRFGILTSAALLRAWRVAVVIILIVSAVATPTTDPFTMTLMAGPMVALYFLSILLGRLVEPREPAIEEPEMLDAETYDLRPGADDPRPPGEGQG